MALSEYMPYGAPELLDGARSRMARSTLLASLSVALLVAGLGAITSRGMRTITLEPREIPGIKFLPPPTEPPRDFRTPARVPPAPPLMHGPAIPVPVPD